MTGRQLSAKPRKISTPTPDQLNAIFEYDGDSGNLIWKVRKCRIHPGTIADSLDNKGYRTVMISGRNYKVHRIIWAMKIGVWPTNQIDHRDTNKSNNRWDNIRPATNQQNHGNRGKNKNNTSGFKDVVKHNGLWAARITVNDKQIWLGRFEKPEHAYEAVKQGHAHYFGEFSRT